MQVNLAVAGDNLMSADPGKGKIPRIFWLAVVLSFGQLHATLNLSQNLADGTRVVHYR